MWLKWCRQIYSPRGLWTTRRIRVHGRKRSRVTYVYCGRQGEPANLISTFMQTHARQFNSLALTRFFSILESSTTNVWNAKNAFLSPPSRVIEVLHSSHVAWQEQWKYFAYERTSFPMGKGIFCSYHATWLPCKTSIWTLDHMKVMHSSSADQSNMGVDVSIHVELNVLSGRNPPQAFLKWIAGVFFQETYFTSSVKRRCCSTLTLQVYSLRLLIVASSSLISLSASVLFVLGCSSTFKRVILKREKRASFFFQSLERQRFSIFGVT